MTRPVGILEDVPVMINQYLILRDSVILDIEDSMVPIILGRPFLATARAIIDVKKEQLVMEIMHKRVEFDILPIVNHQIPYMDTCKGVKVVDEHVNMTLKEKDEQLVDKKKGLDEKFIENPDVREAILRMEARKAKNQAETSTK